MVLEPLRTRFGVKRVVVSSYQAASGAGRALLDELEDQTQAIAAGKEPGVAATSHQLAYNVIPGGWKPDAGGYNDEEMKLVHETRKILHDAELPISPPCLPVPAPPPPTHPAFHKPRDQADTRH